MPRSLPSDGTRVVPSKLAHVVLKTRRYDELVAWWGKLLGAEVVFANAMITFMTYDDEHHRLAIVRIPSLEDRSTDSEGLEHFAFTYHSLGELLFTHQRLKKDGVAPYWCINHGPTTSLYYRDPAGNQVELQVDNFPTVEALRDWFRSGAFAKNPIGVPFDPEKLLQKYQDGVPESELIQQGSA